MYTVCSATYIIVQTPYYTSHCYYYCYYLEFIEFLQAFFEKVSTTSEPRVLVDWQSVSKLCMERLE